MPKARSLSWLLLAALQVMPSLALGQSAAELMVILEKAKAKASPVSSSPASPVVFRGKLPFVVGVAMDEVGLTPDDLERSVSMILALFDELPAGSFVVVASFTREERIVLPPTSDRALLAAALAGLKPGAPGVALPDALFDLVDFLGGLDAAARGILLVSSGNVRDGDLQFEDPLNAAMSRNIPIVALGVGQADGRVLRRIARIARGEYVRMEVADPTMLARALLPHSIAEAPVAPVQGPSQAPSPRERSSASLLGAAAILLALGGILILGTIVILVGRKSFASRPLEVQAPLPTVTRETPRHVAARDAIVGIQEDEGLERTLVINAHPTLRALSGPGAGKNFRLSSSGSTSMGRSRRNDIVVPEDSASAQHCRIDREGDSYVMHDLGATNGTWVNGTQTGRAVLKHGDRLKVGDTVFAVSLLGDRT